MDDSEIVLYTNYILKNIQNHAVQKPNKIAIKTTSGSEISFANLFQKVDNLAINLIKNGFKIGDKVLFLVKPSIESIVVILGVVRAGGVLITADLGMGAENFQSRVDLAKPDWVFAESIFLFLQKFKFLRGLAKSQGLEIPEINSSLKSSKVVSVGGWLPSIKYDFRLSKLIDTSIKTNIIELDSDLSSDLQITFTSGTTSTPKGVVHTVQSFGETVRITCESLNASAEDVFYTNQYYIALPALVTGSTLVFNTNSKFNPKIYFQHLDFYKVTKTFDIPRNFQKLIDYLRLKNLVIPKNVDTIMLGSAPVLKGFLLNLNEIVPAETKVWCVYGMTEILPIAVVEMREKLDFNKTGDLLGKPLPNVSFKILEDGEVAISGPNMCNRFLGGDKIHFVESGDICEIDDLGRLILLSRKKEMIIKKHFNIYPTLFELTINQIDGIQDCVMIGMYDEKIQDEKVILCIVRNTTQNDKDFKKYILSELKFGKNSIDQYALPDEIIFLKEFPLSGRSQKVDRKKLKEIVIRYV